MRLLQPLLGEDPRVRGFFHGCGFNSSGMMLGGGCGYQVSIISILELKKFKSAFSSVPLGVLPRQ